MLLITNFLLEPPVYLFISLTQLTISRGPNVLVVSAWRKKWGKILLNLELKYCFDLICLLGLVLYYILWRSTLGLRCACYLGLILMYKGAYRCHICSRVRPCIVGRPQHRALHLICPLATVTTEPLGRWLATIYYILVL